MQDIINIYFDIHVLLHRICIIKKIWKISMSNWIKQSGKNYIYKIEDVTGLPMRQLSIRDQHDTKPNNEQSPYRSRPQKAPKRQMQNNSNEKINCSIHAQNNKRKANIGGLGLLSALWSGCCLFDTFPISILIFM